MQVHKSNTQPIETNCGILAGCGIAVHHLKALIKKDVKEQDTELRDFVDDMVMFKVGDTEEKSVGGLYSDLVHTKNKVEDIGQNLNTQKKTIVCLEQGGGNKTLQSKPGLPGGSW